MKPVLHTRIVVVDDDSGGRLALQALLRDEGFIVDLAPNGTVALKMVREHPPDVVLTDLRMPEMDGITLCRAIRELNPDLPVILVTAASDMTSSVAALRAGADDYLTKPVDFEAMLLSIQRAIERRAVKIEREQLRARTEDLYQQTLSAVRAHEEVLSIVSHDLRNPLGVILLRAEQLAEPAAPGEPELDVHAIAASILRCAQRMERLISDLLDDSRIRRGHLRLERDAHLLSELLADASDLRPLAQQKRIRIDIRPPDRDQRVACDRARVSQVLGNLLANAIKFSPDGSTVSVIAEQGSGGVQFAVRDEGSGITAEAMPRIFERYWLAPEGGRSGVGLGLYIAKGIVEAHGGRIWAESQPGLGSTFCFFIPESFAPGQPMVSLEPGLEIRPAPA